MARAFFNVFALLLSLLLVLPAAASDARDAREAPDARAKRASAPAAADALEIVVYKSARRLALYRSGDFAKEYPVVLGLQPQGRKRYEGDARTPEGRYRVSAKRAHADWQWFLALDYPNAADRRRYEEEAAAGKLPGGKESPAGIGGDIGIHGNDRLVLQEAGVDWTKGCIAMRADDIRELAREVRVGTPVWIVE